MCKGWLSSEHPVPWGKPPGQHSALLHLFFRQNVRLCSWGAGGISENKKPLKCRPCGGTWEPFNQAQHQFRTGGGGGCLGETQNGTEWVRLELGHSLGALSNRKRPGILKDLKWLFPTHFCKSPVGKRPAGLQWEREEEMMQHGFPYPLCMLAGRCPRMDLFAPLGQRQHALKSMPSLP